VSVTGAAGPECRTVLELTLLPHVATEQANYLFYPTKHLGLIQGLEFELTATRLGLLYLRLPQHLVIPAFLDQTGSPLCFEFQAFYIHTFSSLVFPEVLDQK